MHVGGVCLVASGCLIILGGFTHFVLIQNYTYIAIVKALLYMCMKDTT